MAGLDEVNSRLKESNDTTGINVTGAELQAIIDYAVTRALDRQMMNQMIPTPRLYLWLVVSPLLKRMSQGRTMIMTCQIKGVFRLDKLCFIKRHQLRPVHINNLSPASPETLQEKMGPSIA